MDYSWLDADERPGAWMSQASCFTFLRPADVQALMHDSSLQAVQALDLTGVDESADVLVEPGDDLDTAVFEAGDGWVVVYQNNCYPDQLVNAWLASDDVQQGVVVFWNVNALKEFSLWERGRQVVGFEYPFDRYGSAPDRLNAELQALGMPLEEPSGDWDDLNDSYPQLMTLAERITGVHLAKDFLARPLVAARLNDYDRG